MARCYFNKLRSAALGSTTFAKPRTCNIQESVVWTISRAGGTQGPVCRSINEFDVEVSIEYEVIVTPMTKTLTTASFTATAADNEGTVATITVVTMVPGAAGIALSGDPFSATQVINHVGDTLNPISVSG